MTKPTQAAPSSADKKGASTPKGPGPPAISLPKGGGAVRGIGEKFAANPVNGTGSLTVPVTLSPGRSGFGPALSLSYDSGSGNGPFGLGWSLGLPSITRKTDKGLPQYRDDEESDVFILSGSEDLVPVLVQVSGKWKRVPVTRTVGADVYHVQQYRPRVEGLFARIERWTNVDTGVIHWRSITKENVTTVYGKDNNARIYDPHVTEPPRIFSWLISETYDDKGNAIVYEYKSEDAVNVDLALANEQNRTQYERSTNRYLKRIKYGNRVSRLIEPDLSQTDWMFEVVFDYGEHASDTPAPSDAGQWLCRHDPFSTYRAGFEVRTYRLCQRVLMFHHFPDEDGVGADCLVRSTDFVYRNTRNNPEDLQKGHPVASFISSITSSGYKRTANGYLKRSLPALEFTYSEAVIDEEVREVDAESLANLPHGLEDSQYRWVDLDGEGLSGVLAQQAGGWFYKRNLSPISSEPDKGKSRIVATFASAELVATQPSLAGKSYQFLDLAGDGQLDLVQFDRPLSGYYERTAEGNWSTFAPFPSIPDIDWDDANVKFVDLTGDGHTDIIVSEDKVFTWYRSLAENGYAPAEQVSQAFDEEKGPQLIFADGTQSVYLAEMSGDGLTDLVRIRNGEVCYWPNLGYGRFGAKVSMDNAPLLDQPELFDQRRVRLADVDGSGVSDLLYLGSDGVRIYLNQSGNRFDDALRLNQFPQIDDVVSVTAVDLLGNGTACLVWSSALPGATRQPMRYVDLMGGQKPHLLVHMKNNLGAERVMHYAPSTKFYLADKQNGKPWITRLPFPVHCVERVETYDRVSGNRFVSRYQYHHGYFDPVEREFRGFGMVEQWDTEEIASVPGDEVSSSATNLDVASFVPPVYTKTWFHTGTYLGRGHISNYFAGLLSKHDTGEYYREPGWTDADAKQFLVDDTVMPDGLSLEEERQACRALKGAMLRQEVYGLDGTDKAQHPYKVTEQNFTVERLQTQGPNQHAVFFTFAREALSYHYERNPQDPRITHSITLESDKWGNVRKSASISYGRKQSPLANPTDQNHQTRTLITYQENNFTNAVNDPAQPYEYRAPMLSEERVFELTGYEPASFRFQISDFVTPDGMDPEGRKQVHNFDSELEYEESPASGRQRRLIEHLRTVYRSNDLTTLLAPGQLHSRALAGQSYKLAFTPGLLQKVYKRKPDPNAPEEDLLPNPAQVLGGKSGAQGGYVDLDANGCWWIPSGTLFYSIAANATDPASTAAAEETEAEQHFFQPRKFTDAFDQPTIVDYDAYDMFAARTEDALANENVILNDYRLLQPRRITDSNGSRSEVAFDALGMVVGTALMGKAGGPVEGDSFDAFAADLTSAQIQQFFDAADPRQLAVSHLGTATSRIIYDLEQVPPCAATITRETHVSDLDQGEQTKIQLNLGYTDGLSREAQTKMLAEPGLLDPNDPASPMLALRWASTGAKIYNNKGNPVREYEPFFSPTHQYGIEQHGVSTTLLYDAAGRVVASLHPNHAWDKFVFDPWQQATYDVNDTTLNADGSADPKSDEHVGGFFSRLPEADYLPTWYEQRIGLSPNHPERIAAEKTAVHRQTPSVAHFDTMGRTFLTVAHNRFDRNGSIVEETYFNRVELDIEGNQTVLRDAVTQNNDVLGRVVMRYGYDMLANRIHEENMEGGSRWLLNEATGKPLRAWDMLGNDRRMTYDVLRRPSELFVIANGNERLAERTIYGESQGATGNHRTRIFQVFDGAGVLTNEAYDFKGNVLVSKRNLLLDYKADVDWQQSPAVDNVDLASNMAYDALNRPTSFITPDQTVYRPGYNEANFLETIEANLRGAADPTPFVTSVEYNAKGQRTLIEYANGTTTTYDYDDQTFRLSRLQTTRGPGQNGLVSQIFNNAAIVQDLRFTYDPAGNITRIVDDSLQTITHNNQQVAPVCDYTYDSVYRLIEASGREHIGQTAIAVLPSGSFRDYPFIGMAANPNDLQAVRNYTERYEYDAVGNFLKLIHEAGPTGTWTRDYAYNESSLIEPANKTSNRLSSTTVGQSVENYTYDAHGNTMAMPHLTLMQWNFKNQLQATARQSVNNGTPETTFYVYDASGQRVRKVTERQNGTRKSERIYVGIFETYREYDATGSTVTLETETVRIMDNTQRVALVETKTLANGSEIVDPVPAQSYQFSNHLGSASLELDHNGSLISYEEYHPYGTTSYQARDSVAEVSLKRYRYTGKERDDENGFYYHGARYYVPSLARWATCDPAGVIDSFNLYQYVSANPIRLKDPTGKQDEPDENMSSADPSLNQCSNDSTCEAPPEPATFMQWSEEYVEEKKVEEENKKIGMQLLTGTYKIPPDAKLKIPSHVAPERRNEYLRLKGFQVDEPDAFEEAAQGFSCGAVMGAACEMEGAAVTVGTMVGGIHPASDARDAAIGVKQINEGETFKGAVNVAASGIGLIPLFGDIAKPGVKAVLSLGKAETNAVKAAIGAGKKMTTKEIGQAAELSAAWTLHGEGHEVLGAIQNASNNGLDLVTRKEGQYFVWEIKGNGAQMSSIQKKSAEFIGTRVGDAARHRPEAFDSASQKLAETLWEELGNNNVTYGQFRVKFKE